MCSLYEWGARIGSAYSWFDSFVGKHASPDAVIIVDSEDDKPDQYILTSPHFNGLVNPVDVAARVLALKALWDGAFFIDHGFAYWSLNVVDLINLETNRTYSTGYSDPRASPFGQANQLSVDHLRHRDPFCNFTSTMIFLAKHDDISKGMLQFIGYNGITWISLYALMDFMKTNGWDNARIAKEAVKTESEVKRFAHTANNFAAIGPFARHGDLGHQAPKIAMTLEEAANLVFPAVKKFLLERAHSINLPDIWAREKNRRMPISNKSDILGA